MSEHPQYTKQTRCNNNLNNNNRNDFFRPIISNPSIPMIYNHEQYYYDNNTSMNQSINNLNGIYNMNNLDLERSSISTRNNNVDSKKPVQSSFQNDYYSSNYTTLNNNNEQDINMYMDRNPVNTRRDELEKIRNSDKQDFIKNQNGYMNENNFNDFSVTNTRKGRSDINSSNYIPMPRTLAIPKENI
jgi:hypothetical protein